jgi:hypothetical protein
MEILWELDHEITEVKKCHSVATFGWRSKKASHCPKA